MYTWGSALNANAPTAELFAMLSEVQGSSDRATTGRVTRGGRASDRRPHEGRSAPTSKRSDSLSVRKLDARTRAHAVAIALSEDAIHTVEHDN